MHRNLREKQSSLVNRIGPILLHDDARPRFTSAVPNTDRIKLRNAVSSALLIRPVANLLSLFMPLDNLREKIFNNQTEAKSALNESIGSRTSDEVTGPVEGSCEHGNEPSCFHKMLVSP
jgi:hypothetical protein